MKIQKRLFAMLLSLLLCCCFGVTAFAQEAPDLSRTGSVSVEMTYEGKAVSGGTVTLYRVGEISEEDGNYSFALTGDFTGSGVSLDDISSSVLAEGLAKYVSDKKLSGTQAGIGSDGKVTVDGLELGLYLVVQTKAANGFEPVSPFLISVPMYEDGAYLYDVNAAPKLSTLTKAKATKTPAAPAKAAALPQTGQLNWPVPVLAALGLCLIFIGQTLRCGKKRNPYGA